MELGVMESGTYYEPKTIEVYRTSGLNFDDLDM